MPSPSMRVSQACNHCRSKKRACDGGKPTCRLCARLGIECIYATTDHRRRKRTDSTDLALTKETTKKPAVDRVPSDLERTDATKVISGAKSAELVTSQLGDRNGGEKARREATLGAPWNLGLSHSPKTCSLPRLSTTMSWTDFSALAAIYFAKIHPVYGTFSGEDFWNQALTAWNTEMTVSACHEALFCGVAALSSLFSNLGPRVSSQYIERAVWHLDAHLLAGCGFMQDIDGLILRTLYLRMTVGPRASWLSSCMTLGLIQDLKRDGKSGHSQDYGVSDANGSQIYEDPLGERRFLTVSLLSAWISNESDRPKPFESLLPKKPQFDIQKGASDPCQKLLGLFEMSEVLNTVKSVPETQTFEKLLADVCHYTCGHDVVILSQANLAIVTYRILKSLSAKITTKQATDLTRVCSSGLDAVRRLAEDRQPWHHVANVPFQVLCTLLLLDTKESLLVVSSALSTIQHVAMTFDTPTMQNTLQAATRLISLAQRRKSEDAIGLSTALATVTQAQQKSLNQEEWIAKNNMDIVGIANWDDIDWDQLFANEASLWDIPV